MKRKITLNNVGHLASILAVAISVCSALYPAWAPHRQLLLAVAAICAGGWSYFFWTGLRATWKLGKKKDPPQVLLVGGKAYSEVMKEIESDTRLTEQPFIRFKEIVVGEQNDRPRLQSQQDELEKAIMSADSILLMPDFTATSHPQIYSALRSWSHHLPLPVARYYPQEYAYAHSPDFQIVPFHTPRGIVDYASEFLLTRAVDRGRLLQSKLQLTYWLCSAFAVFLISSLILGYVTMENLQNEVKLLRRAQTTPPALQWQIATVLSEFRRTAGRNGFTNDEKVRIRKVLEEWTKIEAQEVSHISENSSPKTLQIFALDEDINKLVPIAQDGERGYPLDPSKSIAGCAFQRRLAVYWNGEKDQTEEIQAWNLHGDAVGEFDKITKQLTLESGTCGFENQKRNDPKKQLLCMPIGVDDNSTVQAVPGVICLLLDEPSDFMSQEWLRSYFFREALPIGVLDLKGLVLPQDAQGVNGPNLKSETKQ